MARKTKPTPTPAPVELPLEWSEPATAAVPSVPTIPPVPEAPSPEPEAAEEPTREGKAGKPEVTVSGKSHRKPVFAPLGPRSLFRDLRPGEERE